MFFHYIYGKNMKKIFTVGSLVALLLLICTKLPTDMNNLPLNSTQPVATPQLVSPSNTQPNVPVTPMLSWIKITNAVSYYVQVSTDSTFTDTTRFVKTDSSLPDNSVSLSLPPG